MTHNSLRLGATAIALSIAVAGCAAFKDSAASSSTLTAALSSTVLPASVINGIAQTCSAAASGLAAATASTKTTLSQTATYANAYCDQINAGTVPSTTTATTPQWLSDGITAVKVAAQVAAVVLPLL